jgi:hypothetical protein
MKHATKVVPIAALAWAVVGASSLVGCEGAEAAETSVAAHGSPGGDATSRLRARLRGFDEVPAVSTTGDGHFEARSDDGTTFTFELTYADLEGHLVEGGAVVGAHIHLGQPGVNGGIAVHLCGTGGRPACPAPPATVTGTFTAADVTGPAGQGIDAGQLDELLRAARAGVTYVNVHTTRFPGGEIRGQVRATGRRGPEGDRGE